jgi:hypothetical protein
MGRWTKVHFKSIDEYTKQEWIVHLADMVVTNKQISFDFTQEAPR